MADLDWPAVLRAVRDRLASLGAFDIGAVSTALHHACGAAADELERQAHEAPPTPMQQSACSHGKQPGDPLCLACERDVARAVLADRAAQEPATVSAAETAGTVRHPAPAPAPNRCVHCRREVGPSPGWHECGPRRASEPVLSPADILDGAEEMLRRIAATACLDLDATEAAAIVAELDRLRGAAKEKP